LILRLRFAFVDSVYFVDLISILMVQGIGSYIPTGYSVLVEEGIEIFV